MSPMPQTVVPQTEEEVQPIEGLRASKRGFSAEKFFRYAVPVWAFMAVLIGLLFLPLSLPILIYQFLKKRLK